MAWKSRVARKGIHVEAVQTTRGPPATTVNVEIHPPVIRGEIGPMAEVEEVVASLPVQTEGAVHWTEEHLQKISEERGASGEPSKQTYSATHYGGCNSPELGVRVKLRTATEAVLTRSGQSGSSSHSVRPEDHANAPPSKARSKRRG